MTSSRIIIKHLVFTGPNLESYGLDFKDGVNLVYGASNTGKSFTLKALDFMFGSSSELQDIKERMGYEKIWLGLTLSNVGDFTLSRATKGGGFELYTGFLSAPNDQKPTILAPIHDAKNENNLSQFFLKNLNFQGKKIVENIYGVTKNLSYRDLIRIFLVDEISIQNERSPIESGQHTSVTEERSVFRLLLTGLDDSAITPVMDPKTFNTSKTVRVEVVQDMIAEVDARLSSDFQNAKDLSDQYKRLTDTLESIQSEFNQVQGSIRKLVEVKQSLSIDIPKAGERLEEIQIHLGRFSQLDNMYGSDIERLAALEEAGFILSLEGRKICPLCGASPESQKHKDDLEGIEKVRTASLSEIKKIESQRNDLAYAVIDLKNEQKGIEAKLLMLKERLKKVEDEIDILAPKANENRLVLKDILTRRDHVRQGVTLLEQRQALATKLDEFNKLKKPTKEDKPNLKVPDSPVHEFCRVVSQVLKAWEFPGECLVSFDEKTHDLKIDGKLRINNGKGVRAVTHAAFKVALLLFCRQNNLPHPGVLVLDTPLLTYRDPLKNPKKGELTDDERILAQSSLKQRFFEHLSSIANLGQFIILENIDPPANIDRLAYVTVFSGNEGSGRYGLFPVLSTEKKS